MTVRRLSPLFLIYGTALISVMGVSILLPVLPRMGAYFGLSNAALGILVVSFTLPGIFLAPVGGILADRLGRKAVLVPCLGIFAVAGCMSALTDSLTNFVLWRVVQGCGAACLGVLYNAIIGDLYPEEAQRLRVMGHAATALSMGAALYPALGGFLGEWGWRYPLFLSALALPLALVAACTPLPRRTESQNMRTYARNALGIVRQPRTVAHFFLTLCTFAILYGPLITYFPLLTTTRFTATPLAIGMVFSVAALGTTAAAGLLGPLSQKISLRSMIALGSMCFILSMLIFPFINSMYAYILPILLYGLGQGLVYPAAMTSLSGLATAESRGIVMAVNGTVLRLAQTLAPALCGLTFIGCGFTGVFMFGALMGLCILYLTPRLFHVPHIKV